jgi:transcription initiation factor TFIIE subunit alpha
MQPPLIRRESRQEVRPSDQKTINKTFYYIDYREFVDVVKYKMYRMKKSFEDSMKHVQCHQIKWTFNCY